MILNLTQLEAAFLIAQKTLETGSLPNFLKNRWLNALEKANERLIEQPYFAFEPNQLTIVSIPQRKNKEIFCRFYQANDGTCRRVDKSGFCQAFYEGFPCWHRAAFLLLGIYFGCSGKIVHEKTSEKFAAAKSVN